MVVGDIKAGLCGEGMPIMNGMVFADELLSFRGGDEGWATGLVLEPAEPARGRRDKGAGMAELEAEEPARVK